MRDRKYYSKKPTNRRLRRGTTAVEVAFVLPVFILFFFGLVEIGRGFMVCHLLADAARAGCRQGVLPGKSNTDVKAAIKTLLTNSQFGDLPPTIKVNGKEADVSTANSGDEITVTVAASADSVTWIPVHRFLNGSISGQFSLAHE